MRNKREIILDFTSLLDVIMLILFFFVIFSQFDTNSAISQAEAAQAQAEAAQAEAKQQMEEAKSEWQEANEALQQANAALDELQQNNALPESIILDGAKEFERALRIKIFLEKNDEWQAVVKYAVTEEGITKYDIIGIIENIRVRSADELADDFNKIIENHGYSNDDALLCEIVYDSSANGTRLVKERSYKMLEILRNEYDYEYLFDSILDLSYAGNEKGEIQ